MQKPPALEQDLANIEKARELPSSGDIATVSKATGISPFKLFRDYRKLKKGRGKLLFGEYLKYELYDTERYSEEERGRFISAYQHWDLFADTTEMDWWAITEDKWISDSLLNAAKLPTPKTLAIVGAGQRQYPGTPTLRTGEELHQFLSKSKNLPVFAKSQNSMWKIGRAHV